MVKECTFFIEIALFTGGFLLKIIKNSIIEPVFANNSK
jgi:hypothetical protein